MDVAASEFYDRKDKTYDLNFKEEVLLLLFSMVDILFLLHDDMQILTYTSDLKNQFFFLLLVHAEIYDFLRIAEKMTISLCRTMMDHKKCQEMV